MPSNCDQTQTFPYTDFVSDREVRNSLKCAYLTMYVEGYKPRLQKEGGKITKPERKDYQQLEQDQAGPSFPATDDGLLDNFGPGQGASG